MHIKTAQSILDNDDEINISLLAEAHAEKQRRAPKKKIPLEKRSNHAWMKLKALAQEEEGWRQRLAKVWNKNKD